MTALLIAVLICPIPPLPTITDALQQQPEATKPPVHQPTPAPIVREPKKSTSVPREARGGIRGTATWYDYHPGQAAAGPGLRRALGSHWRGQTVTVCSFDQPLSCVKDVMLTDWCACSFGRVIDLDVHDFGKLAPPSRGVLKVVVQ